MNQSAIANVLKNTPVIGKCPKWSYELQPNLSIVATVLHMGEVEASCDPQEEHTD